MHNLKDIDVNFDFTTDTPNFWENFLSSEDSAGSGPDPDVLSKKLQEYHCLLWSRKLPNGDFMELTKGSRSNYLTWNGFRFGSDSITASFRYKKYMPMIEKVKEFVGNYSMFMENYLRTSYTIGGAIIFPKRRMSINQCRGINHQVGDRWDLTLECIKRFYNNEESPLADSLEKDRRFFELFVNFKGYVDYFFLQDCVFDDYSSVRFWLGNGEFNYNPFPKTPHEYVKFIEKELKFVEMRNKRIHEYINSF